MQSTIDRYADLPEALGKKNLLSSWIFTTIRLDSNRLNSWICAVVSRLSGWFKLTSRTKRLFFNWICLLEADCSPRAQTNTVTVESEPTGLCCFHLRIANTNCFEFARSRANVDLFSRKRLSVEAFVRNDDRYFKHKSKLPDVVRKLSEMMKTNLFWGWATLKRARLSVIGEIDLDLWIKCLSDSSTLDLLI